MHLHCRHHWEHLPTYFVYCPYYLITIYLFMAINCFSDCCQSLHGIYFVLKVRHSLILQLMEPLKNTYCCSFFMVIASYSSFDPPAAYFSSAKINLNSLVFNSQNGRDSHCDRDYFICKSQSNFIVSATNDFFRWRIKPFFVVPDLTLLVAFHYRPI